MSGLIWCRRQRDHLILSLTIQPGAKSTEIVGVYGDSLKLRLHAPPVDGKANQALLDWLARQLDVPRRVVTLKQGSRARRKQVAIETDESPAWVALRLGMPLSL